MENQKQARKENRTKEQIRQEYEQKRAYHVAQVEAWTAKIAKLDEVKLPRMRKPSMTSVFKAAKNDFSTEEMLAIVEAAKRRKMEMGAI